MTASYGAPALACSATCRMPAMPDRSPTTTALAAGRAARASSALAALRACSVTECPPPASSLAAISPRPSAEPVMSTRDISNPLQAERRGTPGGRRTAAAGGRLPEGHLAPVGTGGDVDDDPGQPAEVRHGTNLRGGDGTAVRR